MPNSIDSHVILGFDFGMKRIGIAIGDTLSLSAKPLTTINARDGIPNWGAIEQLIKEWNIDTLIVGMPYQLDGSNQEITLSAKKFSNRLREKFRLPVFTIDERMTTKVAKLEMKSKNATMYGIDSIAASLILQAWLYEYQINKQG